MKLKRMLRGSVSSLAIIFYTNAYEEWLKLLCGDEVTGQPGITIH